MITIDEFKKKHSTRSRLLGVDLGSKRIGLSICDENQKIATPFKTINKNKLKDVIVELKQIIEENNIKGIIIGNPINMDGSYGKSSQSAHDISENISKNKFIWVFPLRISDFLFLLLFNSINLLD